MADGDGRARWLFVRHGATLRSPDGAYAGWSDVPLSDEGRRQGARLAERLRDVALARCYASDLGRTRETLETILAPRAVRPAVALDPDLRELHFGAWEGRPYDAIAAERDGPAVLAGRLAAPGGESLADLAARVGRFHDRLMRASCPASQGTTLVVAHGGPLRVLLCRILGLPAEAHWRLCLDYATLSEVRWDEASGAQLVLLNDAGHLQRAGVPA